MHNVTDRQMLEHCLNSMTGEYGEIANVLIVEELKRRLAQPVEVEALSPAEHRNKSNRPWDDKASY